MPCAPGLVETDTTRNGLFKNEAVMQQFLVEKPLGRTGVPDDIAAGVRYLAGPESSWVTGQSIGIEGGAEMVKAPYLESLVRSRFGDEAIDAALAGESPPRERAPSGGQSTSTLGRAVPGPRTARSRRRGTRLRR